MSSAKKIHEDTFAIDDDEPVVVTVRQADRVHRFEAQSVFLSMWHDGKAHAFAGGDLERAPILGAVMVSVMNERGWLDQALTFELATDYRKTAAAIGRALVRHSNLERQHGEAEGSPGDDADAEGGPGPRGS